MVSHSSHSKAPSRYLGNDVTTVCHMAYSCVNGPTGEAAAAAADGGDCRFSQGDKTTDIDSHIVFLSQLRTTNSLPCLLLIDLGKRIASLSSQAKETSFFFVSYRTHFHIFTTFKSRSGIHVYLPNVK